MPAPRSTQSELKHDLPAPLLRPCPLILRGATGSPIQRNPRLLDLPPPDGKPQGRCPRSEALCRYPGTILAAGGPAQRGRLPLPSVPVRGDHAAAVPARARMGLGPRCRLHGHVDRFAAIPQRDKARPIEDIGEDLAASRGDPDQEREVTWTLHLRVGMITGTKP